MLSAGSALSGGSGLGRRGAGLRAGPSRREQPGLPAAVPLCGRCHREPRATAAPSAFANQQRGGRKWSNEAGLSARAPGLRLRIHAEVQTRTPPSPSPQRRRPPSPPDAVPSRLAHPAVMTTVPGPAASSLQQSPTRRDCLIVNGLWAHPLTLFIWRGCIITTVQPACSREVRRRGPGPLGPAQSLCVWCRTGLQRGPVSALAPDSGPRS